MLSIKFWVIKREFFYWLSGPRHKSQDALRATPRCDCFTLLIKAEILSVVFLREIALDKQLFCKLNSNGWMAFDLKMRMTSR